MTPSAQCRQPTAMDFCGRVSPFLRYKAARSRRVRWKSRGMGTYGWKPIWRLGGRGAVAFRQVGHVGRGDELEEVQAGGLDLFAESLRGGRQGGGQRGRVEAGMFKLKDRGSSSRLRAGGECQEGGRRRAAAVWRWHRAGCTTGGRTAAGVPMLENQQLIPIDAANSASAGQWPVSETPLVAGWVLAALPRRKMAYQRWFGI
jgi:hypothetical protein